MHHKNIILALIFVFVGFTAGCAIDVGKTVKPLLEPKNFSSANSSQENLSINSKCKSPKTVKIVNQEIRTKQFNNYIMGNTYYVYPNKFIDDICKYLRRLLNDANIKTSKDATEEIRVSLGEIKMFNVAGGWAHQTEIELKFEIPAADFEESYKALGGSMTLFDSTANAINNSLRVFLSDPKVINYLKCKTP